MPGAIDLVPAGQGLEFIPQVPDKTTLEFKRKVLRDCHVDRFDELAEQGEEITCHMPAAFGAFKCEGFAVDVIG